MKKLSLVINVVIATLILSFIIGFLVSYNYSNRELPQISFQNEPEYNHALKRFAYISGAVNSPGVYEIHEETRIIDLVASAGGLLEDVDQVFLTEQLNMSRIVEDEEHIFIPLNQESEVLSENTGASSDLVNLNTAALDDLISLPNIGKVTAEKIINNRPYSTLNDLLRVEGIGEKTLTSIEELVSL